MRKAKKNLFVDLIILGLSIIFAIWLVQSEFLSSILRESANSKILGSFVGGLFFISVFTAAPAVVLLIEIAKESSALNVAIIGAFGSLAGDMIMFKFLKDRLAHDFYALMGMRKDSERQLHIPRFRWLIVLLAGLIIASPFPDELGLAMLGFSNTRTNLVIPVSLFFNFLGILAITAIAT